jgi:CheY-like chemotaxis protein
MTTIILVVDDEAPIQELITTLLEEHGYLVLSARNGEEALDLALTERPSLVLTDLMMPVMDGVDLCQQLKQHKATQDVPVVIISAAGRSQAAHNVADAVLPKPFDVESLLGVVERYAGPPSDASSR